ncbi:hypothetical protein XBJ1_0308 [Xenorhabdus bovienii SS-2004]|uniref:Uncharacterized protein n=1 Tax=Xenorhabdus bovienii (strain SS-2004) TaxID=406818 RepID=D3UYT0_XENBS|nr:hypothetical protein XBJ1_0308 [Xenorhabdus bovienii SS-2004]
MKVCKPQKKGPKGPFYVPVIMTKIHSHPALFSRSLITPGLRLPEPFGYLG